MCKKVFLSKSVAHRHKKAMYELSGLVFGDRNPFVSRQNSHQTLQAKAIAPRLTFLGIVFI